MIDINIKIQNLDKLQKAFQQAPAKTVEYLQKAVYASTFEVEKNAIDRYFQFKTPRSLRSGMLAQSFAYGRKFAPDGLSASIGPTVKYAPYVYFGTRRGIRPNKYMDRIAQASVKDIQKHFNKSLDLLITYLAI